MLSHLGDFPDYLSFIEDFFEAITMIVALIAFFIVMFSFFSKALKSILGPCGFGIRSRIRTIWICRRNAEAKRAFIEYSIMRTQGKNTSSSNWRKIINEFKDWYSDDGDLIYVVPNVTYLTSEELYEAIDRYFNYIENPKVENAWGIDESHRWRITVEIEEGYVTPTCLLMGLLARYQDNWSEFIKKYISTAYIVESDSDKRGMTKNVLADEIYMTFAWLLWGPSYEIDYEKNWAGVCQISYGDESNSIPAIMPQNSPLVAEFIKELIDEDFGGYGILMRTNVSFFPVKSYYSKLSDIVSPKDEYFYDKIANGDCPFAVQINNYKLQIGFKARKYYCTAYIWTLFELDDDSVVEFRPEKSVAFFEHSNLPDKEPYDFLTNTLIDKCIRHFEEIFSDELYAGRKYIYVCSFNRNIEEKVKCRFEERCNRDDKLAKEFRERISFDCKHTPVDAFSAYDSFFSNMGVLSYETVELSNKASIRDLGIFYTDIFMDCFPNKDERESFDNLLYYLEKGESANDYSYHILIAKGESGDIVGGCIFDYFADNNTGVVEFIAVKTDNQSAGIGTELFRQVQKIMGECSYKVHKKVRPDYIFIEMDNPEKMFSQEKKYVYFWRKHKFKRIHFNYIQPSLSAGQNAVNSLWFAVLQNNSIDKEISANLVMDTIYFYMKYAMQIENPYESPEYIEMSRELRSGTKVQLDEIIEDE